MRLTEDGRGSRDERESNKKIAWECVERKDKEEVKEKKTFG